MDYQQQNAELQRILRDTSKLLQANPDRRDDVLAATLRDLQAAGFTRIRESFLRVVFPAANGTTSVVATAEGSPMPDPSGPEREQARGN